METIDHETYEADAQEHAERLVEYAREDVARDTAYEDEHNAALDLVSDVLAGHNWFARSEYGPAAYGCIIEHGPDEASRYADFISLTETDDPRELTKRAAYLVYETDVLNRALSILNDDE